MASIVRLTERGLPGRLAVRDLARSNAQSGRKHGKYALRDAPLLVWLGAITVAGVPFVAWSPAYWLTYLFYGATVIVALPRTLRNDFSIFAHFGIWTWVNILGGIVLAIFYIKDLSSLANISVLTFATMALALNFNSSKFDQRSAIITFRLLLAALLFATVFGTPVSILLSFAGILADPISNLINYGRFVILTPKLLDTDWTYGHSIAVYYGFAILLLAVSNVVEISLKFRVPVIAFSITLLILSGALVALILAILVLSLWVVENMPLASSLKTAIFILMLAGLATIALAPDFLDSILGFMRFTLQGKDASIYLDDVSSGRYFLNTLLSDAIAQYPFFGLGHSHPLMLIGTGLYTGDIENSAGVESGLRMAAQYGIPYFLTTVALALSPLRMLGTRSRSFRICGAGVALGTFAYSGANGLSSPNNPDFVIFYALMVLLSSPTLAGGKVTSASTTDGRVPRAAGEVRALRTAPRSIGLTYGKGATSRSKLRPR